MSGLHQSDLETRQLQDLYYRLSDLYVYRTHVSGWVIFTCRFRLLLVDSTFPQIVQVVLPSCTAWWFDKLLGLSNLLSHCGHWQSPCFSQEPLRYADPRLPRKSQFHRGRPAAGRRMKKLNHAGFWRFILHQRYIGFVRLWIRAGQDCGGTPSCALQGCFQWTPLFHIADTWSFLRALPCGSSDSGRKRRTFHKGCSGTVSAPDSNNILQK